jgi:hypothetical protein
MGTQGGREWDTRGKRAGHKGGKVDHKVEESEYKEEGSGTRGGKQ